LIQVMIIIMQLK